MISHIDQVAGVVFLNCFGLGKELERLPFAKETVQEDNMVCLVVSFNNIDIQFHLMSCLQHISALKLRQCLFETLEGLSCSFNRVHYAKLIDQCWPFEPSLKYKY